jgi:hypothetical protein
MLLILEYDSCHSWEIGQVREGSWTFLQVIEGARNWHLEELATFPDTPRLDADLAAKQTTDASPIVLSM